MSTLTYLSRTVRAWYRRRRGRVPPKPAKLKLKGTEVVVVTKFRYTFSGLSDPLIDDFDHHEVNTTVGGTALAVQNLPPGTTEFKLDFNRNDVVSMTLTEVDTSGNKSLPSDPLAFTVTDTTPPAKPGALGISNVEQVDVP